MKRTIAILAIFIFFIFCVWLSLGSESVRSSVSSEIMNDLRQIKGAAMLSYVDNLRWPVYPEDSMSLDRYLGRPFFSPGNPRYDLKFSMSGTLVGFDLDTCSLYITPIVKKRLVDRAEENGLYDENGNYYSGGSLIFMFSGAGSMNTAASGEDFFELCESGTLEEIASAIEGGADINVLDRHYWTPLMYAAFRNDPKVVSILLDAGADPNARVEADGLTALKIAVTKREFVEMSIVSLLLERGADINEREEGNQTVLMWAAVNNGSPELISFLIEAGADAKARTIYGSTVLMSACVGNGHLEVIPILLEAGVDVDARDAHGKTALMIAATIPGKVRVLLDAGADPNMRDNDGKRAIDYINHSNRRWRATEEEAYQMLKEVTE